MKLVAALVSMFAAQPAPAQIDPPPLAREVQRARPPAPSLVPEIIDLHSDPLRCAVMEFWALRNSHGDELAMALAFERMVDEHIANSHARNAGKTARKIARYYVARAA